MEINDIFGILVTVLFLLCTCMRLVINLMNEKTTIYNTTRKIQHFFTGITVIVCFVWIILIIKQ